MAKITKLDAAKQQLNAAVRMFFSDYDLIPIHSLVGGSLQIIMDLGAKDGKALGYESLLSNIIPEKRNEFRDMMRKPQNFLKHADRDPDDVLTYKPWEVQFYLFLACSAYGELTGTHTPEARIYLNYFVIHNREVVTDPEYNSLLDSYTASIGDLTGIPKEDYLDYIEQTYREHPTVKGLPIDYEVAKIQL